MKKIEKLTFKTVVIKEGSGITTLAEVLVALGKEIIEVKKKINQIIDEMEKGGE